MEPTNNSVERALRCAVQWRKISFGSRSAEGEVAVARLLTIARTCHMQDQSHSLSERRDPITSKRPARAFSTENSLDHLNCYEICSTVTAVSGAAN